MSITTNHLQEILNRFYFNRIKLADDDVKGWDRATDQAIADVLALLPEKLPVDNDKLPEEQFESEEDEYFTDGWNAYGDQTRRNLIGEMNAPKKEGTL